MSHASHQTPQDKLAAQQTLASLRRSLGDGTVPVVVETIVAACASGASAIDAANVLLGHVAVARGPWRPLVVMAADALRVAQVLETERAGLPLAQLGAAIAAQLRDPAQPPPPPQDDCDGQASAAVDALVARIYGESHRHAGAAATCAALADLAKLCDPAVVLALATRLSSELDGANPNPSPAAATAASAVGEPAHRERLALLEDQWQRLFAAEDAEKTSRFAESKFRKHLIDGTPEAAFRAMAKALAFGVPRVVVAGSVALAAAERAVRFDPENAADPRYAEGYADAICGLELAAATLRLLRHADDPAWLRLLMTTLWVVNGQAALDAPKARRVPLPDAEAIAQTWDHGPELAKLQARVLAGEPERAIAVLRGYLLMALPVQPLCQQLLAVGFEDLHSAPAGQLLAARALAAGVEVFSTLGENPHRELALCGAIRLAAAPLAPPGPHNLGLAVLDRIEGRAPPTVRTPRLWT